MPSEAIHDALWRAHLGLSLGLVTVLLLRRPWRRLAGAQAAYALWLLPLWLAAGALLPRASLPIWALPPVLVTAAQPSALGALSTNTAISMTGLWAAGVLSVAGMHVAWHWRYRQRLKQASGGHLLAPAGDSPGLLGLWHARLVLPADFRQRFDASERRWILAHETAHARRHDNPARLVATVLAGLAWFNPLAWWALHALRQDQELACDAAVMRRFPQCWRAYGLALLKLDGAAGLPPAASAWQSHHPLKERIMLLKNNAAPRAGTRRAARAALALSALLGLAAVQTISSAADATPPARKIKAYEACTKMPRPELPSAVAKGEYLLDVTFKVGSGGQPEAIEVTGDPRLAGLIERTVRSYGCKAKLAGTQVVQQFRFVID